MRRKKRMRVQLSLLSVGLVSALALGSYAFTASNTVPATKAGQGTGTVSGYSATGVSYTLNGTTPESIDAVSFTISPVTTNAVKIQLASGGAWYSCDNTAGAVTCDTTSPQATVTNASTLEVVASQ